MSANSDLLANANRALDLLMPGTEMSIHNGRVCLKPDYPPNSPAKQWRLRPGSGSWTYTRYHWGSTSQAAIANLVKWVQGRPCVPLSTWEYWASTRVKLARDRGRDLVALLRSSGYPEKAYCILCGRHVTSFDWWSRGRVNGPVCWWTEGCKQEPSK